MMFLDSSNRVKENFFEDTNNTSFAFKPFPDSAPVSRDHVSRVNIPLKVIFSEYFFKH